MRKISVLIVMFLFSAVCAFAQTEGTLEAFAKNGKTLGASPLTHTSVKADISGFLARVKVVQEFENKFNQPIEAVYTFPLPENSAVDDMTMLIGTRTIRGKIMKRGEAKKVYETAKSEGKTASLLDQERPNIFTQAVANILPNEKITIEISYVETLKYEDGEYQFVFPMTIAPRYIPGSVKDADKISPPVAATRAGHDVSIEINLDAGVPVDAIRSNSHEINTQNLSANRAKISLKNENEIPNKDFILRYDVTGKRIEDAVLTHRDERGGFFTLILQPPDKFAAEDVTAKEIVFVLDTSGSMGGFPIEKAKEAMKLSLDNLYPNDTFNLITFAGETAILFDEPVPATQTNIEKAQEFLDSRRGGGGTEMMTAIKAALEPSDAQDHIRVVCFMTDGYVGNDAEIIGEVQKHPNARVFSFGIGQSVNRYLLGKIAEEGRGEAEYIALTDDGSKAAKRFYERVRTPLLTDVSIDWNGLPIADVYPNRIGDLFSAKPVVIHGRYTKGASGTIKLRGKVGGQEIVREIAVNFPEAEIKNDVLATLWARTRIDDLTSRGLKYDSDTEETSLDLKAKAKNSIVQLGLDYNLLTQFTSFVAVEEKIVNYQGKPKRVNVPIELPEGMNRATTIGNSNDPHGFIFQVTNGRRTISRAMSNGMANVTNLTLTSGIGMGQGNGQGSGSGNGRGSGSPPPPPAKTISSGVLNGKAINLPAPSYPPAARAVNASGAVNVQVTIDESGNVISASAVSGHPLLRQAAEQAARQTKFAPTMLSGQAVKTTGVFVYNFVDTQSSATVTTNEMQVFENKAENKEEQPPITAEMRAETERREKEAERRKMLAEKLHVWIFALIEPLQKGETTPTANEFKFVRDGKAEVRIQFSNKTPEAIERLKQLGFDVSDNKQDKIVVGRIAIEKIADLAKIVEVKYVLPVAKIARTE